MKMNKWSVVLVLLCLLIIACNKQSDTTTPSTFCWQLLDPAGNKIKLICGKTAADMQALYPDSCSYYQIGGDTACWYIDGRIFVKNATDFELQHYLHCYHYSNAQKVDCGYCQIWYSRQKHTYKPTSNFTYSAVHVQRYCGDTAYTLFQGREIIVRETPDSLITVQFSSTGIF